RQQVCVFPEAFRKVFFLEPLHDGRIRQVGLSNELRGRIHILFLLPMDGNLRLAYLDSHIDGLLWFAGTPLVHTCISRHASTKKAASRKILIAAFLCLRAFSPV